MPAVGAVSVLLAKPALAALLLLLLPMILVDVLVLDRFAKKWVVDTTHPRRRRRRSRAGCGRCCT